MSKLENYIRQVEHGIEENVIQQRILASEYAIMIKYRDELEKLFNRTEKDKTEVQHEDKKH